MRMTRIGPWTAALLLATAPASAEESEAEPTPEPDAQVAQDGADGEGTPEAEAEGKKAEGEKAEGEKAEGEGDEETAEKTSGPRTPDYAVKVQNGIRLILARDLEGAIAALQEALKLDPRKPQAHYFMGIAQREKGEMDPALESLDTAARMADGQPDWQARAYAGKAMALEQKAAGKQTADEDDERPPEAPRIDKPGLKRARQAWERVRDAGDEGAEMVNAQVVDERQKMIDGLIETDETAAKIRTAIAEREKEKAEEEAEGDKKKGKKKR
ncbi:MAG: tetratricopeptide repeat protein [Myxococcota bacterium]